MKVLEATKTMIDNKNQNEYYEILDFFMLRAPLLPINLYQSIFDLEYDHYDAEKEKVIARLANLAENPLIRESISVASLSLLESLPNLMNEQDKKKRDQVLKGFIRYLIRMMSRPTPYGLCSGVAYGKIQEDTKLTLSDVSEYYKRSRPDMEWLLNVIQMLESNPIVVKQLYVSVNSMAYFTGSRVKLPYVNRYGQKGGGIESSSIRSSPVVELVFALAEKPILFDELLTHIHNHYPQVEREIIDKFLNELLQQEFIISNLRPPLTITNTFKYVLEQIEELSGIDELKASLQQVYVHINKYDQSTIGQGEELFKALISSMNKITKVKNPLQVDMGLSADTLTLPASIKSDVAKAAEILWRLSPNTKSASHLNSFKEEFVERYGTDREVPLLLLLDPDLGIGGPATYENPRSLLKYTPPGPRYSSKREALLMEWVLRAQKNKETEIVLNEDMIKQLEPTHPKREDAPPSLELYFTLTALNQEDMNRGKYKLILATSSGSNGAGKTFGRFADMLGDELNEKLREIHEMESEFEQDVIFAELAYLPASGRSTNVAIAPNNRPYEITFGTNSSRNHEYTLPLSDVYVGIDLGRNSLYLKSKKHGKRIIPTTAHMLNMMKGPNIHRFLCELATENQRNWEQFSWGALESASFLPRIRFGNIVISPAKWRLYSYSIKLNKKTSNEEWYDLIQKWKKEWEVPRYVFLTEMDNRILLDLENPITVEELRRDYEKLKEGMHLLLIETGFNFEELLLSGKGGKFVLECVFPIVKKKSTESTVKNTLTIPRRNLEKPVLHHDRAYLPGSDWLFVKIYGISSRIEEFIGWYQKDLYQQVKENKLADTWFFMRYADPLPHIRLRFKGDQHSLCGKLLPIINEWGRKLQNEGLLSKLVIDTYDPEIERYGGPELIQLAEKVFQIDSEVVTDWVRFIREKSLTLELDVIAVISVIDIIECFSIPFEEQLSWFNEYFSHKHYLKEFREKRKIFMELANSANDWEKLQQHPEGKKIHEYLLVRRETFVQYAKQALQYKHENKLHNDYKNIVFSIIHMNLNRLGISSDYERKIMTMVRHILHNLRYQRGVKD